MPPQLRRGAPVNQRIQPLAEPQRLCTCSTCSSQLSIDPLTNKSIRGRYVGAAEYKQHASRDNKQATAHAVYESLVGPLPLPLVPPSTPLFSMNLTASPVHPASTPSPHPTAPPTANDNPDSTSLLIQLKQIKQVADSQSVNRVAPNPKILSFLEPPTYQSPPLPESSPAPQLDPSSPANTRIIDYKVWIERSIHDLKSIQIPSKDSRSHYHVTAILKILHPHLSSENSKIDCLLKDEWERQRQVAIEIGKDAVDTGPYIKCPFTFFDPATLMVYMIVTVLHLLCGVSMDKCEWVLSSLSVLVEHLLDLTSIPRSSVAASDIPTDMRTILKAMDLEPRTQAYVCCPRCYYLYKLDPDNINNFPESCTNRRAEESRPCGRRLHKPRSDSNMPTRRFSYQAIKHWLGWMYSRPDLEEFLDRFHSPLTENCSDRDTWDIWDSPTLRQFLGPDKQRPFTEKHGNEGRLILSLNMDGFNPYGNRIAGKKVSVSAMYMVILNLPPALRYNIENMFLVGIIPGPQEPSHHEINYVLKPLVDDLLDLWNHGVYLTKTSLHPDGRLVRAALIPLVCDLPAARTISGFAHFSSHNFCSECTQTLDDISNLQPKTWTPRQRQEHEKHAKAWLHAKTEAEHESIYKTTGVRWSELLRLPYWDPTKFTVMDSMHMFYLRILQRHCRDIWGMDVQFDNGVGITFDHDPNRPSDEEMKAAEELWRTGTKEEISKLRSAVLKQLCREYGLPYGRRKKRLLKALLDLKANSLQADEHQNSTLASSPQEDTDASAQGDPDTTPDPGATQSNRWEPDMMTEGFIDYIWRTASKTTISRQRKEILLLICAAKCKNNDGTLCHTSEMTVKDLGNLIHQKRIADGVLNEKGKVPNQPKGSNPPNKTRKPKSPKKTRVLGRELLSEVRKDMKRLKLPSWISRAPSHPGESKWGKFGADQWRTFCTVNLPITLTRLWGNADDDSQEAKMLKNFMHLVMAVKLASMRCMTGEWIKQYERHMLRYLTTLLELFPGTTITPYQHMSLHFGNMLRRLGPTHGWRCFPFERYNYVLQQIPTNMKFGEMEQTMFTHFVMAQRLRAAFHPDTIPPAVHALIPHFEKVFQADIRGTYLRDILAFDESFRKQSEEVTWTTKQLASLPDDEYSLLKTWIHDHDKIAVDGQLILGSIFQRARIGRLGQVFQTRDSSEMDSQVVYSTACQDWACGQIRRIFSHTQSTKSGLITRTFLLVDEFEELSDGEKIHDPFRQFSFTAGRLFHSAFKSSPLLLNVNDVICHASLIQDLAVEGVDNAVHCLPLD